MPNLQTLREKRGFVVAATHGYISLTNKIGLAAWESLRINLTNVIYLRGYYSLANGQRSEFPVFFTPLFEDVTPGQTQVQPSRMQAAGQILREQLYPPPPEPTPSAPQESPCSNDDLPEEWFT